MKHRFAIVGFSFIGCCCLASLPANAADPSTRAPLRLTFVAPAAAPLRVATPSRIPASATHRDGRLVAARDQLPLRQRALESVLVGSELADDEPDLSASPDSRFRFEKNGNVARDLSRGYRDMCAKVSNRVWDDPNGRRVKFDIAGKPGLAVEIPLR